LDVTPDSTVISAGEDLWLRVTLDNGHLGCGSLFITDTFFASAADRPQTLLELEIKDADGVPVRRINDSGVIRLRYHVGDLLMLRCGAYYGWRVVVGKPEWEYSLAPGRYTLRARVENRMRAFFEEEPAELSRLLRVTGLDREHVMPLLRDFSVVSDEVRVEVRRE
jgi:hypothetical protein